MTILDLVHTARLWLPLTVGMICAALCLQQRTGTTASDPNLASVAALSLILPLAQVVQFESLLRWLAA